MELLTSVVLYLINIMGYGSQALLDPPYNQAYGLIMFNATLPVDEFVVPGDNFYQYELHWSEAQLAEFKIKAMDYFREKFGFVNPETNSSLNTMLYSTNPLVNTRCVELVGVHVPWDGFKLMDGGWMITVINPAGIILGGEFKGTFAPMGTTFAIGHWLIVRPASFNILWEFQHSAPGIIATTGEGRTSNGEMKVTSMKWGTGISLHITKYTINSANDSAEAIFRNVVTF